LKPSSAAHVTQALLQKEWDGIDGFMEASLNHRLSFIYFLNDGQK
jgi:hypothetical protein